MSEPTRPTPTDRPRPGDLEADEVHTTPRWVYVSVVMAAVLILVVVVVHLAGGGFRHHMGGH
jgi:hypothetical protein